MRSSTFSSLFYIVFALKYNGLGRPPHNGCVNVSTGGTGNHGQPLVVFSSVARPPVFTKVALSSWTHSAGQTMKAAYHELQLQ